MEAGRAWDERSSLCPGGNPPPKLLFSLSTVSLRGNLSLLETLFVCFFPGDLSKWRKAMVPSLPENQGKANQVAIRLI